MDESYSEKDPYITKPYNLANSPNYEFQGYLVYQLRDETVSVTDLSDPDKARLIYRTDIKDDVKGIVNHYLDPILGVYTPIEEVASTLSEGVIGSVDNGVEYSFQITDDKFAFGDTRLINHKTYYFMSLAYGYNRAEENASPYDVSDTAYDGRNQPYISGRRNIQVYSAIPHFIESTGTTTAASYGEGVEITRIEGQGNGGFSLELTEETIADILSSEEHRSLNPTYQQGKGPVSITVVDPLKIPAGNLHLINESSLTTSGAVESYGRWELINFDNGNLIASADDDITIGSERYISSLGLNVRVEQAQNPGADPTNIDNNGLISGTIEFDDMNDRWLSGIADRDDESQFFSIWGFNWIRSGTYTNDNDGQLSDYGNATEDPNGIFESAVIQNNVVASPFGSFEWSGGTWAPYRFASYFNDGPGLQSSITNLAKLENLNSVDIVITDDTALWSRVCVVEAQDDPALSIGGQSKMGLRNSPSVDKQGNPDGSGTNGLGWFPGYAIDIETGERLNIIFSEDSWQTSKMVMICCGIQLEN